MIPSIEHVIKKRHHNRRRLRFMALVLVVLGMVCATWAEMSSLLIEHTWSPSMPLLVFASGFILPALPLWFFDERIGRALVPIPRVECPGCRYNVTSLERPVCPECGLGLPLSGMGILPVLDIQSGGHVSRHGQDAHATSHT